MFQQNAVVESRVDAQGMATGARYRVVGVHTRYSLCFKYTTYELEPMTGGPKLNVSNGHLVLKEVTL